MPSTQPELGPDLRPAFQALAEVRTLPARARPRVGNRNPAQLAYQKLIDELATNVNRDIGLYDPKQLRRLSQSEKAVVLLANPDLVNRFDLEPGPMADVLAGLVDARLWFSAATE